MWNELLYCGQDITISAFSIIFVQHFCEFILCDDAVTIGVLLCDHFLEFDILKTTKKIDNVPHLYLLHCPRVAQTDHDAHQLLSADNPGTIHPIICQLTSKMSRRESTTITTNIHPSFFVSNTLKASSMSLLCSSSALFFCIKATNSCRTNVQHKVKKYTFSFITSKSTVPESSSSISLIISMSSCSVGFWPMDLSTTPSSS